MYIYKTQQGLHRWLFVGVLHLSELVQSHKEHTSVSLQKAANETPGLILKENPALTVYFGVLLGSVSAFWPRSSFSQTSVLFCNISHYCHSIWRQVFTCITLSHRRVHLWNFVVVPDISVYLICLYPAFISGCRDLFYGDAGFSSLCRIPSRKTLWSSLKGSALKFQPLSVSFASPSAGIQAEGGPAGREAASCLQHTHGNPLGHSQPEEVSDPGEWKPPPLSQMNTKWDVPLSKNARWQRWKNNLPCDIIDLSTPIAVTRCFCPSSFNPKDYGQWKQGMFTIYWPFWWGFCIFAC